MHWPFARSKTVRGLDEALEYALGTCTELDEELERTLGTCNELNGERESFSRQRDIEAEARDREHIARIGTESLLDLTRMELEASRLAHSRTKTRAAVGAAHNKGQIKTLKTEHVKNTHYADLILKDHEWHIGGREVAHGRSPLIKYECACGAVIYAREGEL